MMTERGRREPGLSAPAAHTHAWTGSEPMSPRGAPPHHFCCLLPAFHPTCCNSHPSLLFLHNLCFWDAFFSHLLFALCTSPQHSGSGAVLSGSHEVQGHRGTVSQPQLELPPAPQPVSLQQSGEEEAGCSGAPHQGGERGECVREQRAER